MLVTRQIPALWNGISQQPTPVRASNQCEEQVNCVSSVVDGVRRRCGAEHVVKLTSQRLGNAYHHTINRDATERYTTIVTPEGIRVFDLEGNERTVSAPLGWGYLALPGGANPRGSYVCMTVADYTFVLNKTTKVLLDAVGADLDPPSGTYWWLNRPRQTTSALRAIDDPNDFEWRTDGGSIPGGGGGSGSATGGGTVVASSPTTGSPSANFPGTFRGEVQTLQKLPETGFSNGDIYKIIGTDQSDFASFYVIRRAGGWYECPKPGIAHLIKADTMPHALIRQADGTFVFGPFAWEPRHAGDDATNPHPSFVGRCIRDVFFEKNRLGFLADENACESRVGRYDVWHRLTVVDALPDEVLDIGASETKVTKMEFAVPLQGSMMAFSDQVQFKISHKEALHGASVSIDVATQYPITPGVRPAPSGSDIFFSTEGTGYGAIREYFVAQDGVTHDAADITEHVFQYVPQGIHSLVSAPEFDTLYVMTDGAPNRVYVYKYYWKSETEKVQSAWSHWEFGQDTHILTGSVIGPYLYLLIDRPDGTYMERIPMLYGPREAGLDFHVHLDRKVELRGTYDPASDTTVFSLPYIVMPADRDNFKLVLGGSFRDAKGCTPKVTWDGYSRMRLRGEQRGACLAGYAFESRYVPSRQHPQNRQGESVHTGRLQIKNFSVYYTNTAYLKVEVRPYGRLSEPRVTYVEPRAPDVHGLAGLNAPTFVTGKHTAAIQSNASEASIAFVSDSPFGFCLHSAEWEGFYFNRASA